MGVVGFGKERDILRIEGLKKEFYLGDMGGIWEMNYFYFFKIIFFNLKVGVEFLECVLK